MPRTPRLPSGASPSALQLSPAERNLLGQVDGMLDENELALMTGMMPGEVATMLDSLARRGAVHFDGDARPPAREVPTPPPSAPASGTPPPPKSTAEPPPDLDPAKRARIDDLWARLEDITHYELLAVGETADKKQIKSAYYQIAPEFHPDKFFRKEIGGYKHKIEAIFARITLAHDVLTTAQRRSEYDAYLQQTQMNRSTAAVLEHGSEDVAAILAAVERAANAAAGAATSGTHPVVAPSPGDAPRPRDASSPTPMPGRSPTPPPSAPQGPISQISPEEVLRQRREALARKLVGGRPIRPSSAQMQGVQAPDPGAAARQAEAVRLNHQRAYAEAKRAQVTRYIDAGRAALEGADWASAANNYRIAASIEPNDQAIQATCNEGLQKVATALADGYWKQGLYEESQERWGEAALSFSKVCAGRPLDAFAHDRVAHATLRSSSNFRRAVEFSRRAIELDPRRAEFRVTLALGYAGAGMDASSAGELDRALEMAPGDARIAGLVASGRNMAAAIRAARAAGAPAPGQTPPTGPSLRPPAVGGTPQRASSTPPVRISLTPPAGSPAVVAPAPSVRIASALGTPATPHAGAEGDDAGGPVPPRKESGIHAFVSAVRSALAPKEGK